MRFRDTSEIQDDKVIYLLLPDSKWLSANGYITKRKLHKNCLRYLSGYLLSLSHPYTEQWSPLAISSGLSFFISRNYISRDAILDVDAPFLTHTPLRN